MVTFGNDANVTIRGRPAMAIPRRLPGRHTADPATTRRVQLPPIDGDHEAFSPMVTAGRPTPTSVSSVVHVEDVGRALMGATHDISKVRKALVDQRVSGGTSGSRTTTVNTAAFEKVLTDVQTALYSKADAVLAALSRTADMEGLEAVHERRTASREGQRRDERGGRSLGAESGAHGQSGQGDMERGGKGAGIQGKRGGRRERDMVDVDVDALRTLFLNKSHAPSDGRSRPDHALDHIMEARKKGRGGKRAVGGYTLGAKTQRLMRTLPAARRLGTDLVSWKQHKGVTERDVYVDEMKMLDDLVEERNRRVLHGSLATKRNDNAVDVSAVEIHDKGILKLISHGQIGKNVDLSPAFNFGCAPLSNEPVRLYPREEQHRDYIVVTEQGARVVNVHLDQVTGTEGSTLQRREQGLLAKRPEQQARLASNLMQLTSGAGAEGTTDVIGATLSVGIEGAASAAEEEIAELAPEERIMPGTSRRYHGILDQLADHMLAVYHGSLLDTTPEYKSFVRRNRHRWGSVSDVLHALLMILRQYAIKVAYVSGRAVERIAESEGIKLDQNTLLSTLANEQEVANEVANAKVRFKGIGGKTRAAIFIQRHIRGWLQRRIYLRTREQFRAARRIQRAWHQFVERMRMRRQVFAEMERRLTSYKAAQKKFWGEWKSVFRPALLKGCGLSGLAAPSDGPLSPRAEGFGTEEGQRLIKDALRSKRLAAEHRITVVHIPSLAPLLSREVMAEALSVDEEEDKRYMGRNFLARSSMSVDERKKGQEMLARIRKKRKEKVMRGPLDSALWSFRENVSLEENLQLARIFDVRSPLVDLVYVCPFPLPPDIVTYYKRVLGVRSDGREAEEDRRNLEAPPEKRVHFVCPTDHPSYPASMSLARRIMCCTATIQRLKSLCTGRRAVIIPGRVGEADELLSGILGVPILGTSARLARAYGAKSGAKRVFARADVAIPVGAYDIHDEGGLFSSFAKLIARYPSVDSWVLKLDNMTAGSGHATVRVCDLEVLKGVRQQFADSGKNFFSSEKQQLAVHHLMRFLPSCMTDVMNVQDKRLFKSNSAFLAAFYRGGGVLEALPDGNWSSPSGSLLVEPDGTVQILCTQDQVFSPAMPFMHAGSVFPQCSTNVTSFNETLRKIGGECAKAQIYGYVCVNFVTFLDPATKKAVLWAVDLNPWYSLSLASFRMFEYISGGHFDDEAGTFCVPPKGFSAISIRRRRVRFARAVAKRAIERRSLEKVVESLEAFFEVEKQVRREVLAKVCVGGQTPDSAAAVAATSMGNSQMRARIDVHLVRAGFLTVLEMENHCGGYENMQKHLLKLVEMIEVIDLEDDRAYQTMNMTVADALADVRTSERKRLRRYMAAAPRVFHSELSHVTPSVLFNLCQSAGISMDMSLFSGTIFSLCRSFKHRTMAVLGVDSAISSAVMTLVGTLSFIQRSLAGSVWATTQAAGAAKALGSPGEPTDLGASTELSNTVGGTPLGLVVKYGAAAYRVSIILSAFHTVLKVVVDGT